jgi:glycosyltransferase involved in cell wall biosynthesis
LQQVVGGAVSFVLQRVSVLKILFFIPTFNDQKGLSTLVSSLLEKSQNSRVLVVDDGSTPAITLDLTYLQAELRVRLVRLASNEGIGLATSVAIDYMLQENFDCLLRLDADGQHPQSEIENLKEKISSNLADIVWGERINHNSMNTPKAVMGSVTKTFTAWLGRLIFKSKVKDWFTGFFAINRAAAFAAQAAYLERYCEVQLLCIFHAANLRVETHPIEQLERNHGQSSINWLGGVMIVLRSSLMMLLYAMRMRPK